MMKPITITIDEGDRQMLMMAIAHLAVERPGFERALKEISWMLDRGPSFPTPEARKQWEENAEPPAVEMFESFRRFHVKAIEAAHTAQKNAAPILLDGLRTAVDLIDSPFGHDGDSFQCCRFCGEPRCSPEPIDQAAKAVQSAITQRKSGELHHLVAKAEREMHPGELETQEPKIELGELLVMRRHPTPAMLDAVERTAAAYVRGALFSKTGGGMTLAMLGPMLGVMSGVTRHPESHSSTFTKIKFAAIAAFTIKCTGLKKRPGYNDFLITRWAVLGKEADARQLLKNAARRDEIGNTCRWALKSLCGQYREFGERFADDLKKIEDEAAAWMAT